MALVITDTVSKRSVLKDALGSSGFYGFKLSRIKASPGYAKGDPEGIRDVFTVVKRH
jgi:hypothetical protein